MIKMHEHTLNDVYKLNQIKVRMMMMMMMMVMMMIIKVRNEQIRFKVVNVVFQDDVYCSTNSREGGYNSWVCIITFSSHVSTVGCQHWSPSQDEAILDYHAQTEHSDVCLAFLFTSHPFGTTLGQ